jgi:uncharacterized protein (TIGR01244 family)
MGKVRQINQDLAIAGQPSLEEIQQLAAAGYRSIVNLRSPDEIGFLTHEQQKVERLGLQYLNIPIQLSAINPEFALGVVQKIAVMPSPVLLHCDSGTRSSIIALIQIALKQGIGAEQTLQNAANLGLLPAPSKIDQFR